MAKVSVQMQGVKKFERKVSMFEREKIKAVKRVIADTAGMIKNQAQALAPVGEIDGGNLRQSIEIEYFRGGLSARIRVGAEYGIYLEMGTGIYAEEGNGRKTPWVYWSDKLNRFVYTRGIRPQPYFYPAMETGGKYFEREMNKLGV